MNFVDWIMSRHPRTDGWHFFALTKMTQVNLATVRSWCKQNMQGKYRVVPERIRSPILNKPTLIAIVVWLENDDDAVHFKLRWYDLQ
jgi:hypothetical protein